MKHVESRIILEGAPELRTARAGVSLLKRMETVKYLDRVRGTAFREVTGRLLEDPATNGLLWRPLYVAPAHMSTGQEMPSQAFSQAVEGELQHYEFEIGYDHVGIILSGVDAVAQLRPYSARAIRNWVNPAFAQQMLQGFLAS